MESATLEIQGMTCASCAAGIEKRLGTLDGVESCSVNFGTHEASVALRSSMAACFPSSTIVAGIARSWPAERSLIRACWAGCRTTNATWIDFAPPCVSAGARTRDLEQDYGSISGRT